MIIVRNDNDLLEKVLDEKNIQKGMHRVVKKNGCAGIDKLSAKELPHFWREHGEKIKEMIRKGTYVPTPAMRLSVKKGNGGGIRKLAIPSVIDRMLQNAILYILREIYEPIFHKCSYGFLKGKNCFKALEKSMEYIEQGYIYAADMDIENFFDSINHEILLNILSKKIHEKELLILIKRYINMGIMIDNKYIKQKCGVIQGGSLSPLLANIILNEMDWHLEENGIRFVRYADDIAIFSKTCMDVYKDLNCAEEFLNSVLGLNLNKEKTQIGRVDDLEYLGYSFLRKKDYYTLSINDEIEDKMVKKLEKHIYSDNSDLAMWWNKLGAFNRGWLNYYSKVDEETMVSFIEKIEEHEAKLIHKIITEAEEKDESSWTAIFDAKSYISLRQWYETLKEKKHE